MEHFLYGLINDWIVVLQIGTDIKFLKSGPDTDLEHAIGLVGPDREVFCIARKFSFHGFHHIFITEIEQCAVAGFETIDFISIATLPPKTS